MTYSFLAVIIIAIVTAVFGFYERELLIAEQYKTEALEIQIKALQNAAEQMQQRFTDAKMRADQQAEHAAVKANKILNADVPKDCTQAVQWAINQAKEL